MKYLRSLTLVTCVFCALLVMSAAEPASTDARVSGTVVLKGKPLAEGRVFFHLKDGQFFGSKIVDGKYRFDRAPTGIRTVTIEGEGVAAKYAFDDKSGLTVEIKAGGNTLDFVLE